MKAIELFRRAGRYLRMTRRSRGRHTAAYLAEVRQQRQARHAACRVIRPDPTPAASRAFRPPAAPAEVLPPVAPRVFPAEAAPRVFRPEEASAAPRAIRRETAAAEPREFRAPGVLTELRREAPPAPPRRFRTPATLRDLRRQMAEAAQARRTRTARGAALHVVPQGPTLDGLSAVLQRAAVPALTKRVPQATLKRPARPHAATDDDLMRRVLVGLAAL